MKRPSIVLAALLLLVSACNLATAQPAEFANCYLEAVSGGDQDRGWALLHPETRLRMFSGDLRPCLALVGASDWSDSAG